MCNLSNLQSAGFCFLWRKDSVYPSDRILNTSLLRKTRSFFFFFFSHLPGGKNVTQNEIRDGCKENQNSSPLHHEIFSLHKCYSSSSFAMDSLTTIIQDDVLLTCVASSPRQSAEKLVKKENNKLELWRRLFFFFFFLSIFSE